MAHLASSPPAPPSRYRPRAEPSPDWAAAGPGHVGGGARSPQPRGRHFGWKVWNLRAVRAGGGGRRERPGTARPGLARRAAPHCAARPVSGGGAAVGAARAPSGAACSPAGRRVCGRVGQAGQPPPSPRARPAGGAAPPTPPRRPESGSKFVRRRVVVPERHARQEAR